MPISIRNLKSLTAEAVAAVQSDESIPPVARDFIVDRIQSSGAAAVIVDCHESSHEGTTSFHLTVKKIL